DVEDTAVLRPESSLVIRDVTFDEQTLPQRARLVGAGDVQLGGRMTQDLVSSIAQDAFRSRTEVRDAAVDIGREDGIGGVLGNRREEVSTGAEICHEMRGVEGLGGLIGKRLRQRDLPCSE